MKKLVTLEDSLQIMSVIETHHLVLQLYIVTLVVRSTQKFKSPHNFSPL